MAIEISTKERERTGVVLTFLLCMLQSAHAQDRDAEADSAGAGAAAGDVPEVVDEITVIAPRSLRVLERQIERADEAMYGLFNKLNKDPLYNVHCRLEKGFASNIRRRVCKPEFEREIMSEVLEDEIRMGNLGEQNYSSSYSLPASELRDHREELKRRMIRLAEENPELAQAIYKRAELQRAYAKERQRRLNPGDQ